MRAVIFICLLICGCGTEVINVGPPDGGIVDQTSGGIHDLTQSGSVDATQASGERVPRTQLAVLTIRRQAP